MSLIVNRGDTYLIDYPSNPNEHLFVIISNVDLQTNSFVIVGVESASNKRSENLVFLFPGEHPFIKRKTSVAYRFASIMGIAKLESLINQGLAVPNEPMNDILLTRIEKGLFKSTKVDDSVKEFFSNISWPLS